MNTPDATEPKTTRGYWAALMAIVLLGVLVRMYHFQLTMGCDDQLYIITAESLGEPYQEDVPAVFYPRILWRAVLAAWGSLAGLSLETTAVLMFLLSAAATVMVAQAARTAFGNLAGLLAALVYATLPLNVIHDVFTLADNLGVALLAAAVLLFVKYLHRQRLGWLAGCGFVVGLLFSAKSYFILAAVPFGLCLLCEPVNWAARLRRACLFSTLVAAGLSVDFALHYWESGNPLAHFTLMSGAGYGDRIESWWPAGETSTLRRVHGLFFQRIRYFEWLFVGSGIVNGVVLLWGTAFLIFKSRERLDCRVLLMTAALFLAFMSLMPAKFDPFIFVEMQPRYLTVLFPMLAIGAGAALAAALASIKDAAPRRSLAAVLVVGFGFNLVAPNEMLDHHGVQEFVGIRKVLKTAPDAGITELVLPVRHNLFLPDSYYSHGVAFDFRDAEDADWVKASPAYVKERPGRAVFIPERPFPKTDAYLRLKESLEAEGFDIHQVRVPGTTYRSWLYRLDLHDAEDQLVGWVCRPAALAAKDEVATKR